METTFWFCPLTTLQILYLLVDNASGEIVTKIRANPCKIHWLKKWKWQKRDRMNSVVKNWEIKKAIIIRMRRPTIHTKVNRFLNSVRRAHLTKFFLRQMEVLINDNNSKRKNKSNYIEQTELNH